MCRCSFIAHSGTRRDGVLWLVLVEGGRDVVADKRFRCNCQAGLGDYVAGLGLSGRCRHALSPLVILLTLLSVTLPRHRRPPLVHRDPIPPRFGFGSGPRPRLSSLSEPSRSEIPAVPSNASVRPV